MSTPIVNNYKNIQTSLLKITVIAACIIWGNSSNASTTLHGICSNTVPGYSATIKVWEQSVGGTVDVADHTKCAIDNEISSPRTLTCINEGEEEIGDQLIAQSWTCEGYQKEWTQSTSNPNQYVCGMKNASTSKQQKDPPKDLLTKPAQQVKLVNLQPTENGATGNLKTQLKWHGGTYSCSQRTGLYLTAFNSAHFPRNTGFQIATSYYQLAFKDNNKTAVIKFPNNDEYKYAGFNLSQYVCEGGTTWKEAPQLGDNVWICSDSAPPISHS